MNTKSTYGKMKIIFLLFIISVSWSCKKKEPEATPGANEVFMQSTAFNPSSRTISKGTTITWTNKDNTDHTVTADDGVSFDSGTLSKDKTFSFTFSQTGSFPYHCNFHSGMTGTIIVQ